MSWNEILKIGYLIVLVIGAVIYNLKIKNHVKADESTLTGLQNQLSALKGLFNVYFQSSPYKDNVNKIFDVFNNVVLDYAIRNKDGVLNVDLVVDEFKKSCGLVNITLSDDEIAYIKVILSALAVKIDFKKITN